MAEVTQRVIFRVGTETKREFSTLISGYVQPGRAPWHALCSSSSSALMRFCLCVVYTSPAGPQSHFFISLFLAAPNVVIHNTTKLSREGALWQWTLSILFPYISKKVPWCGIHGSLDFFWEGWAFLGPLLCFPLSESCFSPGASHVPMFLHLLSSEIIRQPAYLASPSQIEGMEVFCRDWT